MAWMVHTDDLPPRRWKFEHAQSWHHDGLKARLKRPQQEICFRRSVELAIVAPAADLLRHAAPVDPRRLSEGRVAQSCSRAARAAPAFATCLPRMLRALRS